MYNSNMGMIRIYQKPGKTNRKPGWQQKEAEYREWLAKVRTMPSGIRTPKLDVTKPKPVIEPVREIRKANYVIGSGTKPVPRPDILYRDNPEMLERELRARQRKFATAPAYNKGGDVLITDEMMKDITAGKTRRR